jgi:hypothetical protein
VQRPSALKPGAFHGDELEALSDHHLENWRKSIRGDRKSAATKTESRRVLMRLARSPTFLFKVHQSVIQAKLGSRKVGKPRCDLTDAERQRHVKPKQFARLDAICRDGRRLSAVSPVRHVISLS